MLEFESRKDVVVVFSTMLRRQIGNLSPTVDYLATKPKIFDALLISYGNPDIGLTAGTILRDCMKHEVLCRAVIKSPVFWTLFDAVANAQFEVATDAFATISDALCTHLKTAADFLTVHQARFIEKMKMLMSSDNYVTQRQSLKLISTLIRRRSNYTFMTFYISDAANLRAVMVLLRNKSPIMRFEAFQIFKIFVANPKKTRPVHDILFRNKARLMDFLKTLTSPTKKDDETFNDERNFIITQLANLPNLAAVPAQQLQQASAATAQTTAVQQQQRQWQQQQQQQHANNYTPASIPTQQQQPQQPQLQQQEQILAQAQAQAQMELLQQQYSSVHLYSPSGTPSPITSGLNSSANLNGYFAGAVAPIRQSTDESDTSSNGSGSKSLALAENTNAINSEVQASSNKSNGGSGAGTPGHINLVQHYPLPHEYGSANNGMVSNSSSGLNLNAIVSNASSSSPGAHSPNNNSIGTGGSNNPSGAGSANSSLGASGVTRLKPQLMGAVGSGAVLTPVVQTDQVVLFPGATPALSPVSAASAAALAASAGPSAPSPIVAAFSTASLSSSSSPPFSSSSPSLQLNIVPLGGSNSGRLSPSSTGAGGALKSTASSPLPTSSPQPVALLQQQQQHSSSASSSVSAAPLSLASSLAYSTGGSSVSNATSSATAGSAPGIVIGKQQHLVGEYSGSLSSSPSYASLSRTRSRSRSQSRSRSHSNASSYKGGTGNLNSGTGGSIGGSGAGDGEGGYGSGRLSSSPPPPLPSLAQQQQMMQPQR